MVSFKSIILSLAFAAAVSAQQQIADGQVQVPTTAPAVVTPKPTSVAPPLITGVKPPVVISSGVPVPSANGTFTTGAPAATSPAPYTGAANLLSWSKEIAVAGAAVAGLAML